MFEQLKQINAELADLKKAHLEKSKGLFTDVAKQLFDKHPKLVSFGWKQYTPYFNDGDECTFSAHIDEPDINGVSCYDVNFKDAQITQYTEKVNGEYPKVPNPDYDLELEAANKDVSEFLSNIYESVLRDIFGDHVKIKVTSGGTEVEEYDHD